MPMVDILGSLDEKYEYYSEIKKHLISLGTQIYLSLSENANPQNFGDIFEFTNGFAFKSKDYIDAGTHKVITIKNITDKGFDATTADRITFSADYKKSQLNVGDILLTMTGEVGRCGIVDQENCLLNQRVLKVSGGSPFLTLFSLIVYSDNIRSLAKGSVQQNLGLKELSKFAIPVGKLESYQKYDVIIDELLSIAAIQRKIVELKNLYLRKFFG